VAALLATSASAVIGVSLRLDGIGGVTLSDVDAATAALVLVTDTGLPSDTAAHCVERRGATAAPVGLLAHCSLHAAFRYTNSLSEDRWQVFVVIAAGQYHLAGALPQITRSVTIAGPATAAPGFSGQLAGTFSADFVRVEGGTARLPVPPVDAQPGISLSTIDGMHEYRGLSVGRVNLTVVNLGFVNGYADRGGAIIAAGGGLIRLTNVLVSESYAAYGGAVYSESRVEIRNSEFNANGASICGGALYIVPKMLLSADHSTFRFNRDACSRRPLEVEIAEKVTADGSDDGVIVVGTAVELGAAAWAEEDRRLRDERAERARVYQRWRVSGQPVGAVLMPMVRAERPGRMM